jgi:glycosyltransferase involved in cell wall biosynthesis
VHVVHVYKDVFPSVVGGIEKHIDLIRRALPDVRSDVVVCARSRHGHTEHRCTGVEVHVPELGRRVWSVPVSPAFPAAVHRIDADIVHVHMPNPLGELAAVTDRGRPIVCSYHADIVRQARVAPLYRLLVRGCLRRATEIVVGSRRLGETSPFLEGFGRRTTTVPYFLDTAECSPASVSASDRSSLRERYGGPIVLAVARLVYYKGLDVLIDASRMLDASVVIVGDGPLADELHELARRVDNVHFAGAIGEAELRTHFAAADCFVLPSTSRAESFGIAVMEAQAMGVPAVVTDVGTGTVEAIEPGVTGTVVPAGDPSALAQAIGAILADPLRREAMSKRARERVVARHSLSAGAERLREVYRRAIDSAGSA